MPAVPRNSTSLIYRSRIFWSVAAVFVVVIGILVLIGWQSELTRVCTGPAELVRRGLRKAL